MIVAFSVCVTLRFDSLYVQKNKVLMETLEGKYKEAVLLVYTELAFDASVDFSCTYDCFVGFKSVLISITIGCFVPHLPFCYFCCIYGYATLWWSLPWCPWTIFLPNASF